GYLVLAVAAIQGRAPTWWTWAVFGALPTLHFSALCLAPAQLYVGIRGWKTETMATRIAGPLTTVVLFSLLSRFGEPDQGSLFAAVIRGVQDYWALYADPT